MELFTAAISPSNLALTSLLGLVMLYWLSVILGALDMDSLDIDFDVDADIDVDVDVDVDVDADIDAGAAGPGLLLSFLQFFNFGRIPFMMLISFLLLTMWSISVWTNHEGSLLNPENNFALAALYFVPNLIISLFITKAITAPLVPVFANLDSSSKPFVYEGRTGRLTLPASAENSGQMRLFVEDSVINLRVRALDQELKRGDEVLVIEYLPESGDYLVQKI